MNTFTSERELISHYDQVRKRLMSGNGHAKKEHPLPTYPRLDENALAGILRELQAIRYGQDKLYRMMNIEQRTKLLSSYPHNPQVLSRTVDNILEMVCRDEHVNREEICGSRRHHKITLIRQMVCYLASKWTLKSLPQIGHVLGNRDHSTIHNAIRKITRLRPLDMDLDLRIRRYEEKLEGCEKKAVTSLSDSIDLPTANIGQKETA